MLVASRLVRAIENGIAQTPHPRHELNAKEPAQAEDGFALALRISVECIRLDLRPVLHESIQDMDRLPDTAGDEAGEQGDIVIGDVMVRDATIAAVTNVAGAHQVIFAKLHMRAVGD